MSFFNYLPDQIQTKQLECLKNVVNKCKSKYLTVSIYGGYGLDGLLGELTRDHHDIDMLVIEKDRDSLKEVLLFLGFYLERENDSKEVFKNKELGNEFKIEVNKQNRLAEFTSIGEKEIFPKLENASLNDFSFHTPTVEGHKNIQKMQMKRAKERGWSSRYIHNEHTNKVLEIIKNRPNM